MCECLSWKPPSMSIFALPCLGIEGIRADDRSLLMVEVIRANVRNAQDARDSVETHRILTLDDAATELSRRASSY